LLNKKLANDNPPKSIKLKKNLVTKNLAQLTLLMFLLVN
jgi:hypothetical protein